MAPSEASALIMAAMFVTGPDAVKAHRIPATPSNWRTYQPAPPEDQKSIKKVNLDDKDQHGGIFRDFSPANGFTHRVLAPTGDGRTPVHVDQNHDIEHDEHEPNEDKFCTYLGEGEGFHRFKTWITLCLLRVRRLAG
jgi:hypothetical protein